VYGRGRNLYRALIRRVDRTIVWECPHEHRFSAHAMICAQDELRRLSGAQQGLAL